MFHSLLWPFMLLPRPASTPASSAVIDQIRATISFISVQERNLSIEELSEIHLAMAAAHTYAANTLRFNFTDRANSIISESKIGFLTPCSLPFSMKPTTTATQGRNHRTSPIAVP